MAQGSSNQWQRRLAVPPGPAVQRRQGEARACGVGGCSSSSTAVVWGFLFLAPSLLLSPHTPLIYCDAQGTRSDTQEALMWLKKAAMAGHDIAETELAAHYYKMRLFNKVRRAVSPFLSLSCLPRGRSHTRSLLPRRHRPCSGPCWSASRLRRPQTRVSASCRMTCARRAPPPAGTSRGAMSAVLAWRKNPLRKRSGALSLHARCTTPPVSCTGAGLWSQATSGDALTPLLFCQVPAAGDATRSGHRRQPAAARRIDGDCVAELLATGWE